jgi:hypothetical protein
MIGEKQPIVYSGVVLGTLPGKRQQRRLDRDELDNSPDVRDERPAARRYIGILFECCGVYQRVYPRADQAVYHGRCPRCLQPVRIRVGPQGTGDRLFRARSG